jgi:hypothetical protein
VQFALEFIGTLAKPKDTWDTSARKAFARARTLGLLVGEDVISIQLAPEVRVLLARTKPLEVRLAEHVASFPWCDDTTESRLAAEARAALESGRWKDVQP